MPPPIEVPTQVEETAEELAKCNRCGFCQTRCPVYRATGLEGSVARGHFARLQAVLDRKLPFDDGIKGSVFACLMCRACTAECPPGIETDRVISAARAGYVATRQSRIQRFIFRWLLGHPAALRAAARLLALLKRTRLTLFSKLLRFLPRVDPGLAEADAMMPSARSFLRDRLPRHVAHTASGKQVVYFVGCGIDYMVPEVGEATWELLKALGYGVAPAPNVCCGLPPHSYGDVDAARSLARKNLDALSSLEGEAVITDCASCASFLKEYPRLFPPDDPDHARAVALADRVRELSEFLSESGVAQATSDDPLVVTYHDPCHLSRYQQVTEEPRELLRAIHGVEYRELPEADWCCGAAGSYALTHYQMSMEILARKMENISSTGADVVVTTCPACITQLRYGARKFNVPVTVMHLSQVLLGALGESARESRTT